ncbi:MAG: nuclear transport factor 2 family protein [Chloroflexota bacterium]
MSSDRDTTRIVRSWLLDGPTELPDRVLDAVLDQLPSTHQGRATWWPARRLSHMNTPMRFALGAVAIVIAVVLGINLLGSNIGGPSPTPTPAPSGASEEPVVRAWIDAVNERDQEAATAVMSDRVVVSDTTLEREEAARTILETWCPMDVLSVQRVGDSYIVEAAFVEDDLGTCTAGVPGTTGMFVVEVVDGKVSRLP